MNLLSKLSSSISIFDTPDSFAARKRRMDEVQIKDILSLEEAAYYVGVDPGLLENEVLASGLPAGKIGGQWRFNRWALIEYFATRQDVNDNFKLISSCDPLEVEALLEDYRKGNHFFQNSSLGGAKLSGVDISEIVLSGACLAGSDFSGSSLYGSQLQCANLQRANLKNADLTYADLEGADLYLADLSQAILNGTNLIGADLRGVKVAGTKFQDVIF